MPFYAWDHLPFQQVSSGLSLKKVVCDNCLLGLWQVKAGTVMPQTEHEVDQIVMVRKGKLEMSILDDTRVIEPGTVAIVPARTSHSGVFLEDCELLNVYAPVRPDLV